MTAMHHKCIYIINAASKDLKIMKISCPTNSKDECPFSFHPSRQVSDPFPHLATTVLQS